MHLLEKIFNNRKLLKQLLKDEWDTNVINDISLEELEIMYTSENDNNYINSGCNFTLSNLKIPSHKLHIIYYNFPELNKTGTKVNKTCCDRLNVMYKNDDYENDDYMFEREDSLLVIINEPVSESMKKSIETMYLKNQEILNKQGISDNIKQEMIHNKFPVKLNYFRNIHLFGINSLIINLLNHRLVPTHIPIRDDDEIKLILDKTNCNSDQLPVIMRYDPIAKLIRLNPGNLCKIIRKSDKCGEYIYYRICK